MNQFCVKGLDIPNNDSNIPNVIWAVSMVIIASYMELKYFLVKRISSMKNILIHGLVTIHSPDR